MDKQIKVSSKGKEGDGKEKYCHIRHTEMPKTLKTTI